MCSLRNTEFLAPTVLWHLLLLSASGSASVPQRLFFTPVLIWDVITTRKADSPSFPLKDSMWLRSRGHIPVCIVVCQMVAYQQFHVVRSVNYVNSSYAVTSSHTDYNVHAISEVVQYGGSAATRPSLCARGTLDLHLKRTLLFYVK